MNVPPTHEGGIEQLHRDLAALDRADEIANEMEIDDEDDDRLLMGFAAVLGARARA